MNGIERQIDKLGRVVLPISFRKRLNLVENSTVHISLEGDSIIITPSSNFCVLCGADSDPHANIKLCAKCIRRIKDTL